MKKLQTVFLLFSLLIYGSLFAQQKAEKVYETKIENGLSVYAFEDYSNPQIRLELCIRAGFSNQTAENAGFFTLLSNLIQKTARIKFDSVQVNSDATRFILNISPAALEETLYELSECVFNPAFSDSLLAAEIAVLKREVLLSANDAGTMMNAGIDARVFSAEPWRNDSGIYPALFNKLSQNEVRRILTGIQENYFIPGNAALFASGNFQKENLVQETEDAFGRLYSSRRVSHRPLTITKNGKKKFVIHGKDFSDELTQVVIQYGNLTEDECALASAVYNNDVSNMKNVLCNEAVLNIPGAEYVNVAGATKSGSSRLIIQSLLQNVKNISPAKQSEKFYEIVKQTSDISFDEYNQALTRQVFAFNKMVSSSSAYMNTLSELWVQDPYSGSDLPVTQKLENRKNDFEIVSAERVVQKIKNEDPFIFVIVNTKQFNKYKKEFSAGGYEEINSKNASWYTDTLYKNIKNIMDSVPVIEEESEETFVETFINENKKDVRQTFLSNGIPLFMKQNKNTTGVTMLLSVSGGNLRTADDHGFEELMTNLLTMNILRQIRIKQSAGLVLNDFEIYSETGMDSSRIIIECEREDFYSIIGALSSSLIMDEVLPADADRIVQNRKTRKRLENGSTTNQLFSGAVKAVLPKTPYEKIYETQNEILTNTSYEKILQNYPAVLDAARFSVFVCGDVPFDITAQIISDAFSVLKVQTVRPAGHTDLISEKKSKPENFQKNFPYGKQKKVKLVHTFLTDVPAKDAGPMPAVLIPTKSFADPVLYCAASPEAGTDDFYIFNALLPYIQDALTEGVSEKMYLYNCKVTSSRATEYVPFGSFSFSSVERISACDTLYKSIINQFKNDLTNASKSSKTLQNVKTKCINSWFSDAYTNTGCAVLLSQNTENPLEYLEIYRKVNNITSEKILEVVEKYLDFERLYRVYSSEARN
ncbi:MAG: hypothetical protein MJ185_05110 [Treponema sp.]|nr:hypothetical protein [Treponema sp.]